MNHLPSNEFALPPLKRPPVYGVFLWWPEDGEDWIHPFDIGIVRQVVPGNRVFRREDLDHRLLKISYGELTFRVKSTIWYEVKHEGFEVGDYVEVKSRMGQAEPFIGRIKDMVWDHHKKRIEYFLFRSDALQIRAYYCEDLAAADAIHGTDDNLSTKTFYDKKLMDGEDKRRG